MRISIHQPEFFPWPGFFNKIVSCDTMVILDNVQFKKNYFENRCRIKVSGEPLWMTVPVITKGRSKQRIMDVEIDNRSGWGRKHWMTLCQNYQSAPYWSAMAPQLEAIFVDREWHSLRDLNLHIIRYVMEFLGAAFEYRLGSELPVPGSGTELLVELCRSLGGKVYLSGRHGKDYLDESKFADAGISVEYQEFEPPRYEQIGGSFVGPLSIIDLMLNVGQESLRYVRGDA